MRTKNTKANTAREHIFFIIIRQWQSVSGSRTRVCVCVCVCALHRHKASFSLSLSPSLPSPPALGSLIYLLLFCVLYISGYICSAYPRASCLANSKNRIFWLLSHVYVRCPPVSWIKFCYYNIYCQMFARGKSFVCQSLPSSLPLLWHKSRISRVAGRRVKTEMWM